MQEIKILDFGCGLGGNHKFISKRGKYVGIDILEANIAYAKKKYGDDFLLFDGSRIPFADESFDEVHAYDVLEHVDDLELALDELDRVLKKNGKIFITIPAEKSEIFLSKVKPDYFFEVGHKRIVDKKDLLLFFKDRKYGIVSVRPIRGMEALALSLIFWLKKGRIVEFQTGSPRFNKLLVAFIWIFDGRLFITKLKYLFFIYLFTLPIGWIISRIFPKTIYLQFRKYD